MNNNKRLTAQERMESWLNLKSYSGDVDRLKNLTNVQSAMAVMMSSVAICVYDAWFWDDERLHATIHELLLNGVPVDWVDGLAESPATGTVKTMRHYFINFNLLGDEDAAKAREIERTLKQIGKAAGLAAMINHYIAKLKKLDSKLAEEQLSLFNL